MHINKISNQVQSQSFKGFRHEINNIGQPVCRFNFPFDEDCQVAKIQLYRIEVDSEGKYEYFPLGAEIPLSKDGTVVDFNKFDGLGKNDTIGYRIIVGKIPEPDKEGKVGQIKWESVKDTGYYREGINIVPRLSTSPLRQGQSVLTIPDSHRPGAYYADFNSPNTGKIIYDANKQKQAEKIIPNSANTNGGTLAGVEYDINTLKAMGVNTIFSTPIWGGDNKNSSRYWTKNSMQITDEIGNIDNYETFVRNLFANGMQYVDDFAITSEGLEGIHLQYALRWANHNPQTSRWFRMRDTIDNPIVLGVVPENPVNLRHVVINPPVKYNPVTNKIEKNPNYDSSRETTFQVYDKNLLSKEEAEALTTPISKYKVNPNEKELDYNSYMETVMPYSFDYANSRDYQKRLEALIEYNKTSKTPIALDSPEGAMFIGQTSTFKIGKHSEGAVFWDGKDPMAKYSYHISGYDEKLLQAIPDLAQRDYERKLIERGNCEIQDVAIQALKYRAQFVKDAQMLYAASAIGDAKTEKELSSLIGKSLPEEARLNEESIKNVLDGWYNLAPKGQLSRDDITVKALMSLPLDSLELGENTSGVLSTSFFSNRALDEASIGMSRFEAMKTGSELVEPYSKIYSKMDDLYKSELRDFAMAVIRRVNETATEKLLDKEGNYTEYGEYVMDIVGKDIAKYALLKAIAGNKLKTKLMSDDILAGKITYDYPELRKATSLRALGIIAGSPEDEAAALFKHIEKGVDKLTPTDVDYVAKSISQRIKGTNTNSFRLAEAMTNKAALGLNLRLDAAKDVIDMDSVRNGDMSFDEAWDQLIDFWKRAVQQLKEINPNAYVVAELTDVNMLMEDIYGQGNVYDNVTQAGGKYKNYEEALKAFFNETGITSEAGYSYTFTELLKLFSAEFETGYSEKDLNRRVREFRGRMEALINDNSLDYIRNLWTFADNHDKPSVIHGAALDMALFYANLDINLNSMDFSENRDYRIKVLQELTNSDNFAQLPLEAMMNIDNRDYFRTVSTRAVAMSNLMRNCINDTIKDENLKRTLKSALVDLANGNYLGVGNNANLLTMKSIRELSSLEEALRAILNNAGINISKENFNKIIEKAKDIEMIKKYSVQGDFDWAGKVGDRNRYLANKILGYSDNYMKYSPYSVGLAALLMDSYQEVMQENADIIKFKKGSKSFVNKFDREYIEKRSSKLPSFESPQAAMRKNGYAARDFETVIDMIIKQAEFKSGKKFSQAQKDDIMVKLFRSSTEPAVQKTLMYASFLSALPGVPMMYMRDVLGGLGYEEKANNIYLQNRGTVKWSELDNGPLKEYRQKILSMMEDVMSIRSQAGMNAINSGTPYFINTNNKNVPAFLYQDADGSMAISIMNATGINPLHRAEYKVEDGEDVYSINNDNIYVPKQGKLDLAEILLPAGLAIAAGTIFKNIASADGEDYVVQKVKNTYKLVNKSGKPISLTGKTAKNGVMILKKVAFKGKNINPQYNIVSRPYAAKEEPVVGENLAVMSR